MSILIRTIISLLIAMCFITNSYAMAVSMNEVDQSNLHQTTQGHSPVMDCGMSDMGKHTSISSEKMDSSHCQKSLCCVAVTFAQRDRPLQRILQFTTTMDSEYLDELTLGVYQLPYRPPNRILFL
ncbi:hypothetical protein EC846_0964 [Acinetobacter sp. BIGb0102]|uniref:hypothetical protein n=1 Tax=Acinetobacter sp. BIGb0102 TaxID=2485131 RepID=UPI000F4F75EB|nr:hypothetical protein [Acinetobacter sp. BIGb0102]RPE31497.1 hypothetical protein EC846_0964 [Acinetobacter sp. BIGb0102]